MVKPVLILENSTSNLNESTSPEKKKMFHMEGEFTRFQTRNRNDRIYTAENYLPHVQELLERKKSLGVVYGEYDHPTVFDTQLQRASHTIENLFYKKEDNSVQGEIKILSTHWGKEARALISDNCPIFVSSRCAGTTSDEGIVEVKKLFTYDIVGDPGFATTKMSLKCLNESFNYGENVNFRIYDLTKESNFDGLIMDKNNNEFATREQVKEYSQYLAGEISSIRKQITESVSKGADAEKIEKLVAYYEHSQELISKMSQYLDYLSEKVQVAIDKTSTIEDKTKVLEEKTEKIVDHVDYLAENIENTVEFAEHIAEHAQNNIKYTEYAVEKISQVTDFAEHIAEHTQNSIKYGEYIAEQVKNAQIEMESINEKTTNLIEYTEYVKEHVENAINHSDYLAETMGKGIEFSEHIAENLNTVMGYSDYLGENLDRTVKFSEYVAESANKAINYTETIVESLKNKAINEGKTEAFGIPTFEDFEAEYDANKEEEKEEEEKIPSELWEDEDGDGLVDDPNEDSEETHEEDELVASDELGDDIESEEETKEETVNDDLSLESLKKGDFVKVNSIGKIGKVISVNENKVSVEIEGATKTYNKEDLKIKKSNKSNLTESISTLLTEIKKREAANNQEPHFFSFLNQKQKGEFRALSPEQREKVVMAFGENKTYTSTKDVLNIMAEALNENKPTFKDVLVANIPVDVQPIWESLTDSERNTILEQSEWYDLSNTVLIESFWRTRPYPKKDERTMIFESARNSNEYIDDETRSKFLNAFKRY